MGAKIQCAFSEDQTERLTGVRKQQLRYWDRTDFFHPSFSSGLYRASFGRVYSFQDIVALRVLAQLRNSHGVSVQHLRQVKFRLEEVGLTGWCGVKLFVINKRVHWVDSTSGLPQDVASGQYSFKSISLDQMISSAEADVRDFNTRSRESVGRIEKVKSVHSSSAVVAGTRITVAAIKRFKEAGFGVDDILNEYPDLKRKDVIAALNYSEAA